MKISTSQYAQALLELTNGKSEQEVNMITKKFAAQLKRDGQLKNSKKILDKFEEAYNGAHGIVKATIVMRQASTDSSVKEIEEFVKKKYGATQVEMEMVVDAAIKGGIIIKVGDEVMDGSIAHKLDRLKNILSK